MRVCVYREKGYGPDVQVIQMPADVEHDEQMTTRG